MKFLRAEIHNFGSYDHLDFDFNDQGLTLIYGATGSGKSTIQDIIPWILFGQTAKNGSVDDVRNWSNLDKPTKGQIDIELSTGNTITICRERGKNNQNDLYLIENDQLIRGKDISETQKYIVSKLGIDFYYFTISAYYNEFSSTGSFFTSKAPERRELFEKIADLTMAVKLADRIVDVKKGTKKAIFEISERHNKVLGKLEGLKSAQAEAKRNAERWAESQKRTIEELEIKSKGFDEEKRTAIEVAKTKADLYEKTRQETIAKYEKELERKVNKFKEEKVCPKCGDIRTKDANEILELNEHYEDLIKQQKTIKNPHITAQENLQLQENKYIESIAREKNKVNSFSGHITYLQGQLNEFERQSTDLDNQLKIANHKQNSITQLSKIVEQFRAELLKKSINLIEFQVNKYLETYFDSEIRIKFELEETGDKLEIFIWKSGHECSYRQLSKGQRSLLNLAFSVAIMKAASNRSGVNFNCLMFDEALDGLDSELKIKAFNLFSELAMDHETILVIDHNEALQSLFDKKLHVINEGDISTIS